MDTVLLSIIGDYLNHRDSCISVDDTLLRQAKYHQVEGIVYKQTGFPLLENADIIAAYYYVNRMRIANELLELAKGECVECFFVKGLEISKYYYDPYLKTMGDIDLIVKPSERKRFVEVLKRNGYIQKERDSLFVGEWHLYKNRFLIELHNALLYGKESGETENEGLLEYFNNCWKYVTDNRLNENYHFIYLLVHLRKHFMNKGVGIRQFLDLAFFSKAELDWEWIIKELINIKLFKFSQVVFGLIHEWWGITCPLTDKIDQILVEKSTVLILESGVFGFENDNGKNHFINYRIHGISKIRQIIDFIFPSYYQVKTSERYKMINGKPYLLPVFWIYRAIINIKEYKEKTNKLRISESEVEQRKTLFKQWGLLE